MGGTVFPRCDPDDSGQATDTAGLYPTLSLDSRLESSLGPFLTGTPSTRLTVSRWSRTSAIETRFPKTFGKSVYDFNERTSFHPL